MSTGADCHFFEDKVGNWTYKLQRWPYGATEDYDEFGPFGSYEKALKHLHDNHANPGGHGIHRYKEEG